MADRGQERRMVTTAKLGDGSVATTEGTLRKAPSARVEVPVKDLEGAESISLGFRQQMFTLGDGEDKGGVATGAGWGTDAIILTWGDKTAVVRGLDLLRAWVQTFAPEDAKHFPEGA